jgi:hypothetical protein
MSFNSATTIIVGQQFNMRLILIGPHVRKIWLWQFTLSYTLFSAIIEHQTSGGVDRLDKCDNDSYFTNNFLYEQRMVQ